jgi:hypothetical protein
MKAIVGQNKMWMGSYQHMLFIALLIVNTTLQSIFIQYGYGKDEFEIFKFFYDKKDGYYADMGAFDPIIYSTTIYLYEKGWKGINFEINWAKANRFPNVKQEDSTFNVAVGQGGKY